MQRFLLLLLVFCIFGQASIRTAWTLHYQLNRAIYMAQCVNKNKPGLHCDGKCAFKKQMAAREKNNSKAPQLPENFSEIKDIQLFFEAQELPLVCLDLAGARLQLPFYGRFLPDTPASRMLKPPIA